LEALIFKEPPIESLSRKIETEAIVIAEEMIPDLNGTISYVQFSQSMMRNKHLINFLF